MANRTNRFGWLPCSLGLLVKSASTPGSGWRHSAIWSLVVFAVVTILLTEILGTFGWLRPVPLAAGWILSILLLGFVACRWRQQARLGRITQLPLLDAARLIGIIAIVTVVGITAVLSPPNSHDVLPIIFPESSTGHSLGPSPFTRLTT